MVADDLTTEVKTKVNEIGDFTNFTSVRDGPTGFLYEHTPTDRNSKTRPPEPGSDPTIPTSQVGLMSSFV